MPRYYFNIRQGEMLKEDHAGRELPDLNAACEATAEATLALLGAKEKAMTGAVVEICDESRRVIATIPVDKAAEEIIPAAGPHAKDELTDEDKTPGAGVLPAMTIDGDVDPGAG